MSLRSQDTTYDWFMSPWELGHSLYLSEPHSLSSTLSADLLHSPLPADQTPTSSSLPGHQDSPSTLEVHMAAVFLIFMITNYKKTAKPYQT